MQTDRMQSALMHGRAIPKWIAHKWIVGACCVFALGMSDALAQSAGSKSGTDSSSPPPASSLGPRVLPAPVGHAQPRRDAVPQEDLPYKESPEDKALDRKIKSICRGC